MLKEKKTLTYQQVEEPVAVLLAQVPDFGRLTTNLLDVLYDRLEGAEDLPLYTQELSDYYALLRFLQSLGRHQGTNE